MYRQRMFRSLAFIIVLLWGCVPTSYIAEPNLVLRHRKPPALLSPCLTDKLGIAFDDPLPDHQVYENEETIAVHSPRGKILAFVSLTEENGHSLVRYWNGNMYRETKQISGYISDVTRDNWFRMEDALGACG